jgi:hypothetical protein
MLDGVWWPELRRLLVRPKGSWHVHREGNTMCRMSMRTALVRQTIDEAGNLEE